MHSHATLANWRMLTYVGQTSWNLKIRYKEHIRYIRSNNPQSAYALHILQNRHEYGPMNETMRLLKQVNKTTTLIPYERLYIQTLHQAGKLIPERYPGDPNPLFQAVNVPHLTQTWQASSSATRQQHTHSSGQTPNQIKPRHVQYFSLLT